MSHPWFGRSAARRCRGARLARRVVESDNKEISMQRSTLLAYTPVLAFVLLAAPAAHARNVNAPADNVIAVHGLTNPTSHANDTNWVRTSYFTNHSLNQMCGSRCTEAAVVAYDGVHKGWDFHDFNSPGCYIARKAAAIPGVNIAVIGH